MMERQAEYSCSVPPGFRFHPTEEELVGYYLARKVALATHKIDDDIIQEVDLYRIEPWDLPQVNFIIHPSERRCSSSRYGGGGQDEEPTEYYFFSYKDRKYPSGTRTNRATAAGFWKATGRDKPVMSRSRVIGMRKTLVFYKGRAPNGRKTDWIMHEYRLLQANDHHAHAQQNQEEGWVVCRAFQKPIPNQQQRLPLFPSYATPAAAYYDVDHHHLPFLLHPGPAGNLDDYLLLESKTTTKHLYSIPPPLVESPTAAIAGAACAQLQRTAVSENDELMMIQQGDQAAGGIIDWNFLDTLLSSTTTTTSQLHEPSTTFVLQ